MYLNPGNQRFAEIRRGRYVDKSGLIGEMNRRISTSEKLVCVSRPRRFGKSFAADMLCAYYCRNCDSGELFHDLEISKDPTFSKYLNRLNVISLDITGFISALKAAGESVNGVVRSITRNLRLELLTAWPDAAGDSIGAMLSFISRHYGDRFFFIIDEWDALFRDASADLGVQEEYMNFLRELFNKPRARSLPPL